jgi:hypothetical protein
MPDGHWALQVLGWAIATVITLVGAVVVVSVIGMTIESIGQHQEYRERCLKQATNGYEIEKCR